MNETAVSAAETDTPAATWFTTDEVARRFRTAPSTVRYWRHIGFGPKGVKVGRRVLYAGTELKRFEDKLIAGAA